MCAVDPYGVELGYGLPCLLLVVKGVMMSPGAKTPLVAIGSPDCSSVKVGCVPSFVVVVEVLGEVDVPLPALLFCGCRDNSRAAASCSSGTPLLYCKQNRIAPLIQVNRRVLN